MNFPKASATDAGKNEVKWRQNNDLLMQRSRMNKDPILLPIPVDSDANQLINDFRKLKRNKKWQLNDILLQRLAMKGIALNTMPRFIKDLTYTLAIDPQMNLGEINRRLHLLGWYDFEVDEHTLQLDLATA